MTYIEHNGYRRSWVGNGLKMEHVLIAEQVLGRPLPDGAEVHHVDENKANNENTNLVICPSHAYHCLLHVRTKALDATGNPNCRKCHVCKEYDVPENLTVYKKSSGDTDMIFHRSCMYAKTNLRRRRLAAEKRALLAQPQQQEKP